jgi:hypothetical protein
VALTKAERILRAKQTIREALLEQHGKAEEPDAQKIKEAIEAYCAAPAGDWTTLEWRMRAGRHGALTKEHNDAAKRLDKALAALAKVLRDKNLPFNLRHPLSIEAMHKLGLTVYEYEQLDIVEDWQRRARAGSKPWKRWPKDPEARKKAHAAEIAVRLFDHHKLVCTASHSPNNKLIKLAAIVFGQPLRTGKRDKGWYRYCNAAINAARLKHTQRIPTQTPPLK